MVRSSRSAPAPGPSLRRFAGRSTTGTGAAAFPAAASRSARGITSATGAHGGPTTLSNLALLCRRHHRAVHEGLPGRLPTRRRASVPSSWRAVMGGVTHVPGRDGALVASGWGLAEQTGLPLPAVPFLLAAGALAGNGQLSLALVLAAAALGSLVSDSVWYWIGRVGGGRVLRWLCRIFLEPDSCVRRTQDAFGRYGARSLLLAKFVPGFNTAAPPLAGI